MCQTDVQKGENSFQTALRQQPFISYFISVKVKSNKSFLKTTPDVKTNIQQQQQQKTSNKTTTKKEP